MTVPKVRTQGLCEAVTLVGSKRVHVVIEGSGFLMLKAEIDDPVEGPESVKLYLQSPDGRIIQKYLYSHERVIWSSR